MEYDLKEVLLKIKDEKKLTISFLQRGLLINFNKASKVFNELITNGFVNSDGITNKQKISTELGEEYKPGIKIIFLDVDGVLNCHSTKDICCDYIGIDDKKVGLLKEIVDATGAIIVLISTWKEYWTNDPQLKKEQDVMATYLDKKLAKQGLIIADKTLDDNSFERSQGILDYIEIQKSKGVVISEFIILDDLVFDYQETGLINRLIQTGFYKNGLGKRHVNRAIERLKDE